MLEHPSELDICDQMASSEERLSRAAADQQLGSSSSGQPSQPTSVDTATARQDVLPFSMAAAGGGEEVQPDQIIVKIGMVGDSGIGKTSLMVRYVEKRWDQEYVGGCLTIVTIVLLSVLELRSVRHSHLALFHWVQKPLASTSWRNALSFRMLQ